MRRNVYVIVSLLACSSVSPRTMTRVCVGVCLYCVFYLAFSVSISYWLSGKWWKKREMEEMEERMKKTFYTESLYSLSISSFCSLWQTVNSFHPCMNSDGFFSSQLFESCSSPSSCTLPSIVESYHNHAQLMIWLTKIPIKISGDDKERYPFWHLHLTL